MSRVLPPCAHPWDADPEPLPSVHLHPGYRPSCLPLRPEVAGNKGFSNQAIDCRLWIHLFPCEAKQGELHEQKSQKTYGLAICFRRKRCSCRTRAHSPTHMTQATQCGPAPDPELHPCRKDLPRKRRGPANLRLNPLHRPLPSATGCPSAVRTPAPTNSPRRCKSWSNRSLEKRHLTFLPGSRPSSSEGQSLFHLLSHDARTGPISAVAGPSE